MVPLFQIPQTSIRAYLAKCRQICCSNIRIHYNNILKYQLNALPHGKIGKSGKKILSQNRISWEPDTPNFFPTDPMELEEAIYYLCMPSNSFGYMSREGEPFTGKFGTPWPNWPNIGVNPRKVKFLANVHHADLQLVLSDDKRLLINILRLSWAQLDVPVKNGRALTEVDPTRLDTEFSQVTPCLIIGI